MIKFFKIDAVHPINRRVIESNLLSDEVTELYQELLDAGYEEDNIDLTTTQIVMEAGDKIELSSEFIDHIDDIDDLEYSNREDHQLFTVKHTFEYIFGDNIPPVITGTLEKKRLDRHGRGQMLVVWDGVPEHNHWKQTNTDFLKPIGYKFAPVTYDEIPILECDDDMLNDEDRVIKYLMLDNDMTEAEALSYMKIVHKAMNKAECVMYRP